MFSEYPLDGHVSISPADPPSTFETQFTTLTGDGHLLDAPCRPSIHAHGLLDLQLQHRLRSPQRYRSPQAPPRSTLTTTGFPCWVKRALGSTNSLPWMKVHSIPPGSPTPGSSCTCPDGLHQLRTRYSRTAPWRSIVQGGRRHQLVKCGAVNAW